jgi:DNA-binding NarL/FixJ family response regulator
MALSLLSNKTGINLLLVGSRVYNTMVTRAELQKYIDIHRIDVVASGSEAFRKLLTVSYDLIMVDRKLPDDKSISFIKQAKSMDTGSDILLLSMESAEEDLISELEKAGIHYIMVNESDNHDLINTVKKVASARKTGPERRNTIHDFLAGEQGDALTRTSLALNHEVNNALTSIIGAAQLLLNGDYNLDSRARSKVDIIQQGAIRIRDTLINLSCAARADSGNRPSGILRDRRTPRFVFDDETIP